MGETMKHRLQTAAGKAKYKLRQQTVEPIFGIIKSVLGFRQFLLRGKEKVGLEHYTRDQRQRDAVADLDGVIGLSVTPIRGLSLELVA
jgi:hypothetical protein